jgi:CelD/BcsL family acetyltransferase involved in cellulose biosynthesis
LSPPKQTRARILTDSASLARVLPEWDQLWQRCPHATTFQRPEWLFSWMQVFQPRAPLLIEIRCGDRLVGAAPMLIYQRGAERVLALMGGGVSDYLDVLFDPAYIDEATDLLWDLLPRIAGWDAVEFTDLPPTSCLLHKNPSGWEYARTAHNVCPVLPLPSKLEKLGSVFPRRQRKNLRNARNRLRSLGESHIEIAAENNLQEVLGSMFRLHTTRWAQAGEPGVLSNPMVQEFHRSVSPKLLRKRILRLYSLRVRARAIAVLHAFFEREVAYYYLQGFDPAFAWFSPGTQILGAVVEDAIRHGMRKVNFLRGQERYKYGWGTEDSPTYRIQARTPVGELDDWQREERPTYGVPATAVP